MTEATHKLEGTRPTVVVIIPFYNGSKFIERAVQSVLDQSVPADEFIVVNDGSKEEERAFLYNLAERYPFKIVDKENGGQGSARNAGVAASTSEFICFLDQDDFYLDNHIQILTEALPRRSMHFGFIYADLHMADGNGNLIYTSIVKEHTDCNPKRSLIDLLRHDMFILPSASLISRTAFEAVGGYDPQFMGYEDDDLFLRIFRKGYSNHYVDQPVTVWCMHSESTSRSVQMSRSRFKYFKKLSAAFPDDPDKRLYFFRDCIVPRFGRAFVVDAFFAITRKLEFRPEINNILREFVSIVCADRNISAFYKALLKLAAFALTSFPDRLLIALGNVARFLSLRRILFPK